MARGVRDALEVSRFHGPALAGLHEPGLLPDADRVRDRIAQARRTGEAVLVLGDFDADGLTGLAILVRSLRRLGVRTEPWVPSRLEDGHGLAIRAVDAAVELGCGLIITVDCGTTSGTEIAAARGRGIDVIVTDHHHVPEERPSAVALVNPRRVESRYPDDRLAGSGVAFKVAQLLLADEPGGPEAALGFADLATIGSVADVASMLGENRAIARLGLDLIRTAPRPGIAALLGAAGVDPASVDLETIAFTIAPRINAAGRMGDALLAARLLLSDDPAEAEALAAELERVNGTRRDASRAALEAARTTAASRAEDAAIIVLGDWPVGVLGLVAARLAEDHGRPAIVATTIGATIRASCRGSGRPHLAQTLETCADLLDRSGGHAGAAGFEIRPDRWDPFVERFLAAAAESAPGLDARPELALDLAMPAREVDYALLRELSGLDPTGPGNPEPVIAVLGLTATRVRAASGGHTQLTLRRERDVLDAIAFDRPDLATTVREGDRLDVAARVASRTFGGYESIQLEVRDVAVSGSHAAAAAILGTTMAAVAVGAAS